MITRALIIKRPWISMILTGAKTWEMRSSQTHIRGRIGLIEQGTSLIVGEVDLVDSLPKINKEKFNCAWGMHKISSEFEIVEKWSYPWVLENAEWYNKPIHYNHPQGAVIWVNLDKDK